MKQTISILGCGWLGTALAADLISKGYTVKGSSTSKEKRVKLKSIGVAPYVIDISQRTLDISKFLSSDILIILIPSKSVEHFKYLISQIEKSETEKVIFISSTSVYPTINGIVTEETAVIKSPLIEIESLFETNILFKSTIIRFGGLFGYDRKPGNFIKDNKINNPEGFVNLIHRDDCIRIIEKIIDTNTWNEVLNSCADTHPKRSEFYQKEMGKLGRFEPIFNLESLNEYKIVSNEKLKTLLDYTFKYDDLMAF